MTTNMIKNPGFYKNDELVREIDENLAQIIQLDWDDIDCSDVDAITPFNIVKDLEVDEIVFPSYITRIGNNAFRDCDTIKKIELGEDLESIGKHAFRNTNIELLDIPDNVEYIQRDAFVNCKKLKTVIIGNRVSRIDGMCFHNCPLESVDFKRFNRWRVANIMLDCNYLKDPITAARYLSKDYDGYCWSYSFLYKLNREEN